MDCNTAKCYGSDKIRTPVISVTNPVPEPTELSPTPTKTWFLITNLSMVPALQFVSELGCNEIKLITILH